MAFQLPADLSGKSVEELNALLGEATTEITDITARFDAGEQLSDDEILYLDSLSEAVATLQAAIDEAEPEAEAPAPVSAADVIARAKAAVAGPEDEEESDDDEGDEPEDVVEAEIVDEAPAQVAAAAKGKTTMTKAPAKRPVSFAGLKSRKTPADTPDATPENRWKISPNAPGFRPEDYGTFTDFAAMGNALEEARARHGAKLNRPVSGPRFRQSLATLERILPGVPVGDPHALFEAINKACAEIPGHGRVTTKSLVAAGGWCAPSEQIYTFCGIPEAQDLISLPEIPISRGGLRWPKEPDLSAIFAGFEFYFTEAELEAVDGGGVPTAVKHCIEIPCPDEFEELRLNVVGYCVTAGILQRAGWPESIAFVLEALVQEHMRAMSRRTILDMWNGSGAPKVFDAALQVGGTSSVLNSLALAATNLRLNKGYGSTHPIEIVAPVWFFEAIRADLAMMEGVDTKSVSDGQIRGWLSDRNIVGQFVADWQTRDLALPGHMDTLRWPGHVDVIMYPAGTWFRHLSNVLDVGVIYPKEELVLNRYTEMFTEDQIAVGKRCDRSINLRIPFWANGGFGNMVTIAYTDTTPDSGAGGVVGATPIDGGAVGEGVDVKTYTLATTGAPGGGTFKLQIQGEKTATIAYNASAAAVKSAITALDEAYAPYVQTSGGALPTAITIKVPEQWAIAVSDKALTGGTSPDVTLTAA